MFRIFFFNFHLSFQTSACDLKSFLALNLKRQMIQAIHTGCPHLAGDPEKQSEILAKYKKFGDMVISDLI